MLPSHEFNAFAMDFGDRACIGLQLGIFRVQTLLEQLVADAEVRSFFAVDGEDEPENRTLVSGLFDLMLALIIFHEFAHIKNGHIRFLNDQGDGMVYMGEHSTSSVDRAGNLVRQTLEYDADAFAADFALRTAISLSRGGPALPAYAKFGQEAARLRGVYFASALIFFIVQPYCDIPEEIWDYQHPPGFLRLMCLAATMATLGQKRPEVYGAMEAHSKAFTDTFELLVKALPEVSLPAPKKHVKDAAAYASQYSIQIKRTWAEIRPALVPHQLGKGNLAPVDPEVL